MIDDRRRQRGRHRLLTASLATLALSLASLWLAAGATGGATINGPTVAEGVSPQGVPWEIRGEHWRDRAAFEFSFDPPAYDGVGYGTQFQLPIPNSFVFTAISGSDISPYPESDLSGITDRAVRTLVVRMSDGPELTFRPALAPQRIREHHPWLRTLRFFDVFFSSDVEARVMRAFDAEGKLLAKRVSHRGAF